MTLVEQHIIRKSNSQFKQIDELAFLSKNLYNAALYAIKQHYLQTGKWLRAFDIDTLFKNVNQPDYFALPTNTSQQILILLDQNIKSYFALLKKYKKDKKSLNGCPKFPKYKDKLSGRYPIVFTSNQARLHLDKGIIKFPKKVNLKPLTSKVQNLNQVRIIPRSGCYVIEVVYTKPEIVADLNDNYLSIDLGLNNLATCFDSSKDSFILNGRPLKSINQYYNKKRAQYQSELEKRHKKKSSKRLANLTNKRNNKIKNYLHKSSRTVVNYCVENKISNIIIGQNKEWKQSINIGSKTNQSFVQIPHSRFISMIEYKSKLAGIEVTITEESYTSKCSALDLEPIQRHDTYLGKRVKRGKFISKSGISLNADLNGAMNILRKVTGNKVLNESSIQTLTSRGQVDWPMKVNFHEKFYKNGHICS